GAISRTKHGPPAFRRRSLRPQDQPLANRPDRAAGNHRRNPADGSAPAGPSTARQKQAMSRDSRHGGRAVAALPAMPSNGNTPSDHSSRDSAVSSHPGETRATRRDSVARSSVSRLSFLALPSRPANHLRARRRESPPCDRGAEPYHRRSALG